MYCTPSTQTIPAVLVTVTIFVATVVTIVILCKISLGPALNVVDAPPPATVTAPALLSRAKLTIIEVPIGTVCCKVIVRVEFVLSTNAQFVPLAAAPKADIAPVEFTGVFPPAALKPFPVIGEPVEVIEVAFKVVLVVTPVTVTVAIPEPFKVTVCDAPPLIL